MRYLANHLDISQQTALLADIRDVVQKAPLFTPVMPRWGTPFSVRMSNCGEYGWVSDKSGYRYQTTHPVNGDAWPEMPQSLLNLWAELCGTRFAPQACLINYYDTDAKMGLHQDKDESNFDAPVLSISLGDSCKFRIGGHERKDKTRSFTLNSGDVIILEKDTRLAFHGVDRIMGGTNTLLDKPGRINLTLRLVT